MVGFVKYCPQCRRYTPHNYANKKCQSCGSKPWDGRIHKKMPKPPKISGLRGTKGKMNKTGSSWTKSIKKKLKVKQWK